MKTLIISFILAIPFIGFGQGITSKSNGNIIFIGDMVSAKMSDSIKCLHVDDSGIVRFDYPVAKPDTLSAYLLVTTKQMGIAYQKRGFVIRQYDREDIFLDCEKRIIKPPYTVWNFKIIQK